MEIWISQIFLAVGITSITGLLAYGAAEVYWRITKEKNPYVMMILTKASIVLFLMPFSFITICLQYMEYRDGSWLQVGDFLIGSTTIINNVCTVLGIIWFIGFLVRFIIITKEDFKLYDNLKGNVPADVEEYLHIFDYYRNEFGKRNSRCKNVELVMNDMIISPFTIGILKPVIVLPFAKYTEKQLHMIFEHEFNHIAVNDLLWKKLAVVIGWIHWFNPMAYRLHNGIVLMEEIVCDCKSNTDNEFFTQKEYGWFVSNLKDNDIISSCMTALCESEDKMYWRVKYMLNAKKFRVVKKSTAFLCGLVLSVVAVLPAYGVAAKAGELHSELIYMTEERILVDNQNEVLTAVDDENVVEVELHPGSELYTSRLTLDYTIPSGTRIVYGYKTMSAGQSITVSANCSDSSVTYWIGIKNSATGQIWYVEGSGALTQNFPISSGGSYSAFVHNKSSKTMTVEGIAYYYN